MGFKKEKETPFFPKEAYILKMIDNRGEREREKEQMERGNKEKNKKERERKVGSEGGREKNYFS